MRMKPSTRSRLQRIRRFVVHRILHADDTPHRIALGVAIGVFVAWMPFVGLQMVLVLVIAALLRANKVVGLPVVWLNNPLTAPVNLLCFWLGCWVLRMEGNGAQIVQAIQDALAPGVNVPHRIVGFFHAVEDVFLPWLVGSMIVGMVTAVPAYLLTRRAVEGVRRRRARRRSGLAAARAAKESGSDSKALAAAGLADPPPAVEPESNP
jgi:uncharacterized protein (DUF2062 family)